ncbi:MAG: DnaD domain protein [Oscillospiraceae bacterium]|nr:DnaD domain protein [Oscillospiraceae bacterium]
MPKFKQKKNSVSIGFDFMEKYLSSADPTYIVVYIYALGLAAEDIEMSIEDIAERLNMAGADVAGAFEFWQSEGVFSVNGETVIFNEISQNKNLFPGKSNKIPEVGGKTGNKAEKITSPSSGAEHTNNKYAAGKNYNNADISNDIRIDRLLADMLEKAQEFLGKPLSTNEIQTLYSIYEQIGLPPQVIILLIEYCVSNKKTNMNYIEKIAVSWSEKGIDTIEKALDFLAGESAKKDLMNELKKIFRLYERGFTEPEEDIIMNWINNYNTDTELIKYAYEITIMNTNKFSVQYMDKIIERWHNDGITDINAAKESSERFRQEKQNRNRYDVYQGSSYNYKDIENRVWNDKKNK